MKGKKKSFEDISETLLGQEIFDFFQLEKSGTLVTTQFTCIHVLTLLRTSTDANSCPVSVTQKTKLFEFDEMFTFFIDTIVAGALLFTSIPLLIGLCVYAEYKYDVGSIFLP